MKMRLQLLSIGLWGLGSLAFGQGATEHDEGIYIFLGADLRAEHRSRYVPVISGDEKGLFVESLKGIRRVRFAANCDLQPVVSLSETYAEIVEVDYSYGYLAQSRREAAAMAEVNRAAAGADFEKMQLNEQIVPGAAPGSADELNNTRIGDEISNIEFSQSNLEEQTRNAVQSGDFEGEGLSDTLFVKMIIEPNHDVEDAYCAIVVNYIKDDAYSRFKGHHNSAVKVRKVGDLLGGIPNKVKFSALLGEANYEEATYELYLFSGAGAPIALSSSQGLKRLTRAQLLRFQELEAKTAEES